MFLMVINSSAVIGEAVAFHCAVHIALRDLDCFFQGLIFQFLIKPIFKVVINYNLILRSHLLVIVINRFFCQPFRFCRKRFINLPHFCNLCADASCPQMLFRATASTQKIIAVCFQTA